MLGSINFINNIGEASTINLLHPPSSPNFASKSKGGAVSDQCHMTMPGIGGVTVLCPAMTLIRMCGIMHCYAFPLPCQTNIAVFSGWLFWHQIFCAIFGYAWFNFRTLMN